MPSLLIQNLVLCQHLIDSQAAKVAGVGPYFRGVFVLLSKIIEMLGACLLVMSDSCDPVDCSPPGSSVHGVSQERILE